MVETPEYVAFVRRSIRALGRRAGEDPEALPLIADLAAELDAAMGEAARSAHAAGWSWTEIAARLGVSRQAARQRFGSREQ